MAWLYLMVAGVLEVAWAMGLKASDGWSKLGPSAFTLVTMIASFSLLSVALKTIPLGTGYAIWTGIGAVGTVAVGMIFLGEPRDAARIFCLLMIVAGIIGLKIVSPH